MINSMRVGGGGSWSLHLGTQLAEYTCSRIAYCSVRASVRSKFKLGFVNFINGFLINKITD